MGFAAIGASAQTGFMLGPRFGYGINGVIDPRTDYTPKPGNRDYGFDLNANYGVAAVYMPFKKFGFQAELNANEAGFNETYSVNKVDTVYKYRLKYFEVPLLLRFQTGGEIARFYVLGGPQLNFLTNARAQLDQNGEKVGDEQDLKARYNKSGASLLIEPGVAISVLPDLMSVGLGLRGTYGIGDLYIKDLQVEDTTKNNRFGGSANLTVLFTLFGGD